MVAHSKFYTRHHKSLFTVFRKKIKLKKHNKCLSLLKSHKNRLDHYTYQNVNKGLRIE